MNFKCEDTLLRFTLSKLSTAISFASVVSIAGVSPYALANTQVTTLEKTKLSANKRVESKSQTELDSVSVSSNLMQDINDVADYIPGVDVASMGRFGNNGFNIRGMEGDRIAITVDGLTQGETLDPPSFAPYEYFRASRNSTEIEHMKAIQIVKGANSVTSGSGSLGGAVMFTTMSASDLLDGDENQTRGYFKFGYDERDEQAQGTIAVANKFGGLETLLMYTKRQGSESSNHSGNPDKTGASREKPDPLDFNSDAMLFKTQYQFNDVHELGFVVENDDNLSQVENLSRVSSSIQRRFSDDEQNRARYGVFYYLTLDTVAFDELEVRFDYQDIFTSGVTNMHYAACLEYSPSYQCLALGEAYLRQEQRELTQQTSTLAFDFSKQLVTGQMRHDIVYGTSFETRELENNMWDHRYNGLTTDSGYQQLRRPLADGTTHYPIKDANFIPQTDVAIWNAYLRDSVTVTDALTLAAGLRYDDHSYQPEFDQYFTNDQGLVKDVDMNAFTWQLSANYEITPNHSVIVDLGTGFRAPSVEQVYYGSRGATVDDWQLVPNYDLKPESAFNMELGYQWQNDNGRVRVSVFDSEYTDFIDNVTYTRDLAIPTTKRVYDPSCGCYKQMEVTTDDYQRPENIGEASVQGVELDALYRFNNGLELRAAYTHSEGEYDNGDPMLTVSPDSAVVSVGYDSKSLWRVMAQVRHQAEKKASDAYTTNAQGEQVQATDFLSDTSTVVDLIANFDITDNMVINIAARNLFDEEYYNWQRIRFVSEGSGGFRGGVANDGIKRYSEPGRSVSANINVRF